MRATTTSSANSLLPHALSSHGPRHRTSRSRYTGLLPVFGQFQYPTVPFRPPRSSRTPIGERCRPPSLTWRERDRRREDPMASTDRRGPARSVVGQRTAQTAGRTGQPGAVRGVGVGAADQGALADQDVEADRAVHRVAMHPQGSARGRHDAGRAARSDQSPGRGRTAQGCRQRTPVHAAGIAGPESAVRRREWVNGNATAPSAARRSASSAATCAVDAFNVSATRPPKRHARAAAANGWCKLTPGSASGAHAVVRPARRRCDQPMRRCARGARGAETARPAKRPCPRCGWPGFLREATGWCGSCSHPGAAEAAAANLSRVRPTAPACRARSLLAVLSA
jgi:hypothetical protein